METKKASSEGTKSPVARAGRIKKSAAYEIAALRKRIGLKSR